MQQVINTDGGYTVCTLQAFCTQTYLFFGMLVAGKTTTANLKPATWLRQATPAHRFPNILYISLFITLLLIAHLDELFLNITHSAALVIAVGPELPFHLICPRQGIYPIHHHNHLLLPLPCDCLLCQVLQGISCALCHKGCRNGDVS